MKWLVFVTLFLVVLKNGYGFLFKDGIIATTEQGNVLGSVRVNRKGGKFYSFTSIPYAKPPVGDLRFMVSKNMVLCRRKSSVCSVMLIRSLKH